MMSEEHMNNIFDDCRVKEVMLMFLHIISSVALSNILEICKAMLHVDSNQIKSKIIIRWM